MKILIVGKGSIGYRHAKIFKSLGCNVSFLRTNQSNISNNDKTSFKEYFDIRKLNIKFFDLVCICNPTSLHIKTLQKLLFYSKKFFIEKPVASSEKDLKDLIKIKKKHKIDIFNGYMLRHDPRIKFIKKKINLEKEKPNIINFIWRTYLPYWHPYEDYRSGYAFSNKLGGGVVRTCSHEIDLALYLNGPVKKVKVYKLKDNLKSQIEGAVLIVLRHTNYSISNILLDFSSKVFERYFDISLREKILKWNFKKNYIETITEKKKIKKTFKKSNIDQIYINQDKYILQNLKKFYSNKLWGDVLLTEKIIQACLKSMKKNKTIYLSNY